MRLDEISFLSDDATADQKEKQRAERARLLTRELRSQGITDPNYIKAVIATSMKETGQDLLPRSEDFYYKSRPADYLRQNFSALRNMSDSDIEKLKAQSKSNPAQFANIVYAPGTKIGKSLGNIEADDGWKFRGRGFIQLTGRGAYSEASKSLFGDDRLVKNPDLLLDPTIAAKTSAWRVKKDQEAWARQLGIDAKKPLSQSDALRLAGSQVAGADLQKAHPSSIRGQGWSKLQQSIGLVKDDYLKDTGTSNIASNVPPIPPSTTIGKIEPLPDGPKRPTLTIVPDTPLVDIDTKPSAGATSGPKTKVDDRARQDTKEKLATTDAEPKSRLLTPDEERSGKVSDVFKLSETVNINLGDVFNELRRVFNQ